MLRAWMSCLLVITAVGCGELPDFSWSSLPFFAMRLDTPAEQHATFAQAWAAFQKHDDQTAYSLFNGMVTAYPALADHNLYLAGRSAERLDRQRNAARHFEQLLRDYPQSVHSASAALAAGKIALQQGRLDAARAHLYRAMNEATDAPTRRAAQLAVAEAEDQAGDFAAAYRNFSAVREADPGSPDSKLAEAHVFALRAAHPELVPSGSDRLVEARLLLAERDYTAAESLATAILENPVGVDPAQVMRLQADAQYGAGKLDPAMKTYWSISQRYPGSPEAPLAIVHMGTLLWNRDRDRAALRIFEDFLRRYPRHEKVPDVLYAIGRIQQKAGNEADALSRYEQLASRYPDSKLASEAGWRVGWIHFQARRYRPAAAAFAAQRGSGAIATYWQARAVEAGGDRREAQRLYQSIAANEPTSYYGVWARRRIDGLAGGTLRFNATAPAEATPVTVPAAPFTDAFHLPRYQELQACGVDSLARLELAAVEREHGDDAAAQRFLVDAYQSVNGYNAAIRLVRAGAAADLSQDDRRRITHPLAFWPLVRQAADTQGVDPFLMVAIMRQESVFDPNARSTADARGLLQLLPSTAERIAPTVAGLNEPIDLYEPATNIAISARYIRTLLDRYDTDPLKTTAAYNGGETAVDRWLQQATSSDGDVFVENISYRETRDYVKRVVGNYAEYAKLYGR